MSEGSVLAAFVLAALGVYILMRWFYRPLTWGLALVYRGLLGGAALWGIDYVGRAVGAHIALNPVTALVAGLLGLPGVALIVAFGFLA